MQVTKVWWDGEKLMAEPIPESEIYKEPAQQEVCPTCGEYEPRTGTCGTSPNDKRALCNRNAPQPAQQEPVARIAELEETVRQLNHALREATESPTFMGEPVSAEPAASIKGVDEYGPMLNWYKHWVNFPVGTKFYTSPPAHRKPLTDEEFLELLLRKGTQEIVGVTTFVGESIHMQGKIGLLRSAKIIKEFVEAAHGIKENT